MRKDLIHKTAESRKRKAESYSGLKSQSTDAYWLRLYRLKIYTAILFAILTIGACAADSSKLYDVDATGTDIKFVLEALARRSGVNIVVSPDITGPINAHLSQMTIDSIMDRLATVQGFGWKVDGNTYLVASNDRLNPPPPQKADPGPSVQSVFVYLCKNVKPVELMATIEKAFPSIKVAEGPGSSSPILSAQDTGLSSASATKLSMTNSTSSTDTTGAIKNSNKIVLIGSTVEIDGVKSMLEQLDLPRKQISIEVSIMEIRSSASKEIGIDWNWNNYNISDVPADMLKGQLPSGGSSSGTSTDLTGNANMINPGIGFGRFSKSPTQITGTISMLMKDGAATLLAKPNVSVLDGESAGILIGSKVKYPVLSERDSNGKPIYSTAEEPVGISLQIAARVTGDNDVILALYPQVSMLTGYIDNLPQISTREAQTTVSVKDGATLAIGGLISENEIKDASKVPFLGDIPILGQFFRHSKKTKERTEIVILLTPKIACDVQKR